MSNTEELESRLKNVNDYFTRKASEVTVNQEALNLMSELYINIHIEIEKLDFGKYGIPLALLTAANFAQVGAAIIYITDAGYNYINSLLGADINHPYAPDSAKQWHESEYKKNCEVARDTVWAKRIENYNSIIS